MHESDVTSWYGRYLAVFAGLCRGERDDVEALLEYYDAPMMTATDPAPVWRSDADDVVAFARGQVDAARASGYDRTAVLDTSTTVLNPGCAWFGGDFVRHRADDSVISRFRASYLVTEVSGRRRISALVLHTAASTGPVDG